VGGKMLNDNIRPEVAKFATRMELVLRDNDYKGGWKQTSFAYLLYQLHLETVELYKALDNPTFSKEAVGQIIKEATDVANFAMMIADRAEIEQDARS
jgi:hypothetical protein